MPGVSTTSVSAVVRFDPLRTHTTNENGYVRPRNVRKIIDNTMKLRHFSHKSKLGVRFGCLQLGRLAVNCVAQEVLLSELVIHLTHLLLLKYMPYRFHYRQVVV